jgi:CheY-like chemotaxis protein
VAKILVADDNSNIQKMVGLALKDHGIEVVAVGNGEAAVRKISDVHPDLVLADVFMPVRNGYEVCKYVKENKDLAHIPVILLVGAFDPLDEQEAQSAGADGVLKKPFVPPDPLISMVKSALVRAGVPHKGFNPNKEKEPAEIPPAPEVAAAPKVRAPKPEVPEFSTAESFVDEVPAQPAAVNIGSGQQPVAFGSLLGTEEEAPELTAPKGMGIERDWRSAKAQEQEEQEEEEEPSGTGPWRRDGGDESLGEEATPVKGHDFGGGERHESWTPTREKQDLTQEPEFVESVPSAMLERRDAAPPFAGDAWAAAIGTKADAKTAVAEAEHPAARESDLEKLVTEVMQQPAPVVAEPAAIAEPEEQPNRETPAELASVPQPTTIENPPAAIVTQESPSVPERSFVQDTPVAEVPQASPTNAWFSPPPPNPWEAEATKASRLASSWDALSSPASDTEVHGEVPFTPTSAPDEIEVVSDSGGVSEVSTAAAETVREEAAQIVEQAEHFAEVTAATREASGAAQDLAANLDMDAIVAKVLARLSPSLLHDATRELLKPVIEAVIREELNSRKQ